MNISLRSSLKQVFELYRMSLRLNSLLYFVYNRNSFQSFCILLGVQMAFDSHFTREYSGNDKLKSDI
jgi:hypothetical protein